MFAGKLCMYEFRVRWVRVRWVRVRGLGVRVRDFGVLVLD